MDEPNNRYVEVYRSDPTGFEGIFLSYLKKPMDIPANVINKFHEHVINNDDKTEEELTLLLHAARPQEDKKWRESDSSDIYKAKKLFAALQYFVPTFDIESYLDIGANNYRRIEYIANKLNIESGKYYGINIDEKSDGAMTYYITRNDEVIKPYNGWDIPVINDIEQYDLISMEATLHHVPQEILEKLVPNISKRCRKYLLLKENDLTTPESIAYFIWQHALYSKTGKITTFTREDINTEALRNMFEEVGFTYIGKTGVNYFARAYYHLFQK